MEGQVGFSGFHTESSHRWLYMIYLTTDCRLPHTLCLYLSFLPLFSMHPSFPHMCTFCFISSLFRCMAHTSGSLPWFVKPPTSAWGWLSQITLAPTRHPQGWKAPTLQTNNWTWFLMDTSGAGWMHISLEATAPVSKAICGTVQPSLISTRLGQNRPLGQIIKDIYGTPHFWHSNYHLTDLKIFNTSKKFARHEFKRGTRWLTFGVYAA